VRLVLICVFAFAALAAPAHALQIFGEVDANGDPVVYAGQSVTWQACLGSACRAFDADTWQAGETAPGTVFTARAGSEAASLPGWGGRLGATSAPALGGHAVVGGTVWPVAAKWSGGWGGERDDLRVEACKQAVCRTLAAPEWVFHGKRAVVIGRDVAGWSLRVVDRRRNASEVRPQVLITDPGDVPPLAAGPLVALSPAVGVSGATLRKHAMRTKRGIVVGHAACAKTCTVKLRVSQGRHTFRRSLRGHGTIALQLARTLRRGTLRVKVTIDGHAAASGRVKL
jgi:hypothetical protein